MQDDCETVKKIFTVIIGDSYNASQWLPVFKKEKKAYTENTRWIPLWSETISLCKKLNIIYYIITCNLILFCELILSDSLIQWTDSIH